MKKLSEFSVDVLAKYIENKREIESLKELIKHSETKVKKFESDNSYIEETGLIYDIKFCADDIPF